MSEEDEDQPTERPLGFVMFPDAKRVEVARKLRVGQMVGTLGIDSKSLDVLRGVQGAIATRVAGIEPFTKLAEGMLGKIAGATLGTIPEGSAFANLGRLPSPEVVNPLLGMRDSVEVLANITPLEAQTREAVEEVHAVLEMLLAVEQAREDRERAEAAEQHELDAAREAREAAREKRERRRFWVTTIVAAGAIVSSIATPCVLYAIS